MGLQDNFFTVHVLPLRFKQGALGILGYLGYISYHPLLIVQGDVDLTLTIRFSLHTRFYIAGTVYTCIQVMLFTTWISRYSVY